MIVNSVAYADVRHFDIHYYIFPTYWRHASDQNLA